MTTGNEPTKEKKEGRTKKNADLECVEERKKKQFKIESVKVSKTEKSAWRRRRRHRF